MLTPADLLFYLCALGLLGGGVLVVISRGTVLGVLGLIFACLNVSSLLVLMGADFLAMIFLMIYVGAIAVLFLFVVMMTGGAAENGLPGLWAFLRPARLPGICIGLVWILELGAAFLIRGIEPLGTLESTPLPDAAAIGVVLFGNYALLFEAVGMILLSAMVGAVVLTLRPRREAKRQDITSQLRRRPEDTLQMHKIPLGAGAFDTAQEPTPEPKTEGGPA